MSLVDNATYRNTEIIGRAFLSLSTEVTKNVMSTIMSEIIFEVSADEVDGGYSANALGYGIDTEAETLEELRQNVKEAVECYFDETMKRPGLIRLHFVRDEALAL